MNYNVPEGRMGTVRRPILVTGSHCSGTTWVGRMLALSPDVAYIYEPFNIKPKPGICGAPFRNWFTYVTTENEHLYFSHLRRTVELRYSLLKQLAVSRSWRERRRAAQEKARFLKWRLAGRRPLLKDPIAIFSAEWLATRFDMDVVVLVRHPAAFAGTLKRKQWQHPFADFLEQPLLMQRHLQPFEAEIRAFAGERRNIVDQAALLWRIINSRVIEYQEKFPFWTLIRHEDLSRDPLPGFERLYAALGLEMTPEIASTIRLHSADSPGPQRGAGVNPRVHRDSAANIWSWKDRLTASEIARVKDQVSDVSTYFYLEEDWQRESMG